MKVTLIGTEGQSPIRQARATVLMHQEKLWWALAGLWASTQRTKYETANRIPVNQAGMP